jgi:hypothetical protein
MDIFIGEQVGGQARLPYKLYRLLCGLFRRIAIGIIGHRTFFFSYS